MWRCGDFDRTFTFPAVQRSAISIPRLPISQSDRGSRLLLAVILFIGSVLRIWGIWFGLPYPEARPDETALISLALPMTYSGFNPHFFHWPSLEIYVLAAVYRIHYSIGRNVLHTFRQNFD